MLKKSNAYYVIEVTPWPLTTTISIFSLIIGLIMKMQLKYLSNIITILALIALIISIYNWWNDIIIEKPHPVLKGIQTGDHVYFVHSYHFDCSNANNTLA